MGPATQPAALQLTPDDSAWTRALVSRQHTDNRTRTHPRVSGPQALVSLQRGHDPLLAHATALLPGLRLLTLPFEPWQTDRTSAWPAAAGEGSQATHESGKLGNGCCW